MDEAYPTEPVVLHPCEHCGRKFNPTSLIKHAQACKSGKTSRPTVYRPRSSQPTASGHSSSTPTKLLGVARPIMSAHHAEKGESGFVGLFNQGATCYMNSLLQTLYMTPEFRLALYQWTYNENVNPPKAQCIPYQLQLLFAHLQLSPARAVDTSALTNSFGWSAAAHFQQHDVQELCRVLFDALSDSFRASSTPTASSSSSSSATLVTELYEGTMADSIECLTCGSVRSRFDGYQDIPVVVRGMSTLTQALDFFVAPDYLSGDNQYACEKCGVKVDAKKGMTFYSFPYLLTIQLKRFTFDLETMQRVKLNDNIAFPLTLNLRAYASADAEEPPPEYQLLSILVHAGGALGGHYHAYIRDCATGRWFDFNDSIITEVSRQQLQAMIGGGGETVVDPDADATKTGEVPVGGGGGRGATRLSANPYMLLYRRIDPSRNVDNVPASAVPPHLSAIVGEHAAEWARGRAAAEEALAQRTYPVYIQWPEGIVEPPSAVDAYGRRIRKHYSVTIRKDKTIAEATAAAFSTLQVNAELASAFSHVTLDMVRLRAYSSRDGTAGPPFEPLSATLVELAVPSNTPMLLEIRNDSGVFDEYRSDVMPLYVRMWKRGSDGGFGPTLPLTLERESTLLDLKTTIESMFGVAAGCLRVFCVRENMGRDCEQLVGDSYRLVTDLALAPGSVLSVEECPEGMEQDGLASSDVLKDHETRQHTIALRFNALGSSEYTLCVKVDDRLSVLDLKRTIAPLLGVSSDEFRLLRGTRNGAPLESSSSHSATTTLADALLYDGAGLWADAAVVPPEQVIVKLVYLDKSGDEAKLKPLLDRALFKVTDTLAQTQEALFSLDRVQALGAHSPTCIRLRSVTGRKAKAIVKGTGTLKELVPTLTEGKVFCIEVLQKPEVLSGTDVVFWLRRWSAHSRSLGQRIEVTLDGRSTIAELEAVASRLGVMGGLAASSLSSSSPVVAGEVEERGRSEVGGTPLPAPSTSPPSSSIPSVESSGGACDSLQDRSSDNTTAVAPSSTAEPWSDTESDVSSASSSTTASSSTVVSSSGPLDGDPVLIIKPFDHQADDVKAIAGLDFARDNKRPLLNAISEYPWHVSDGDTLLFMYASERVGPRKAKASAAPVKARPRPSGDGPSVELVEKRNRRPRVKEEGIRITVSRSTSGSVATLAGGDESTRTHAGGGGDGGGGGGEVAGGGELSGVQPV